MKRILDHIRLHLLERAGLHEPKRPKLPDFTSLRAESWSEEFENYMRNRLIMGSFRYETWGEKRAKGDQYDYPSYIISKCGQYVSTGNLECLVDIANGAMLEFVFGSHPRAHFEAVDDGSIHCKLKEGNY